VRAQIERGAEPPSDIVEAIEDAIGHLAMQEVDATVPCRPVSVQSPGAAIEQCGLQGGCLGRGAQSAGISRSGCGYAASLKRWLLAGNYGTRGMAVDEYARSLMMCRDAGLGNLYC
jgi:hypothetical protein